MYSAIGHDHAAELMIETVDALTSQGMDVEQAINEYGPGQQEISVRHTDALGAADNQMKFRDTVRGVAQRHGLYASFAAKPFPDAIGSGAHVHFSLWDPSGARSLLYDPALPGGLSPLGRHFIAGVAEHLPALTALTVPSYNSFRRLTQCLGVGDHRLGVRQQGGRAARRVAVLPARGAEYNIEFKASDGSANPYLSLGALIACGLDGIERELEPGEPCERDPALMSAGPAGAREGAATAVGDGRRARRAGEGHACSWTRSVRCSSRCYLAVRRSEEAAFAARTSDFEVRNHFYRF